MKAVILDEEAQKELNEAIDWYNDRQQRLGHELQNEVEEAVDRIRLDPGVGARYRSTAYRFYRVKRFPYILYYLDLADAIWVAAIAHERRRPGYWRKRVP
jgi:toxin ParE1/3/4